jgi:uncharacterized protein YjiS (DUF1127 family)
MPHVQAYAFYLGSQLITSQSPPKELTMRVFDKIKQFAENRRAIRELGTLDDHVLHDLGISRSHIRSAVLGNSRS